MTNNKGFILLCLQQLVLRNVLVALTHIRMDTRQLDIRLDTWQLDIRQDTRQLDIRLDTRQLDIRLDTRQLDIRLVLRASLTTSIQRRKQDFEIDRFQVKNLQVKLVFRKSRTMRVLNQKLKRNDQQVLKLKAELTRKCAFFASLFYIFLQHL